MGFFAYRHLGLAVRTFTIIYKIAVFRRGAMKYITSPLFFITIIFAQWSTNPASPQSLGSGVQVQLAATSDGGVYVAWLSDGNNYHVLFQRLNSMGEPQWADNGMVVSNNANASWIAVYHLNLAVDSEDNAIITTMDQRAGGAWEVYAYKIASDGTMLWGNDGVSLTSSSVSNMSPRLTVLPDNSVVVTWTHNDDTVLFQRISSDGTLLWDTGILIEDDDATLISPEPIVTNDGNVLIQWIRQTGPFWASNSELYLQKYDYDGIAEWSNPIVAAGPVVFPMGNWLQQSVADDISGSFSAWTEISGNVQNARVQHINEEGVLSWTGGVDLSTNSSNFRMSPQLTFSENTQELMAVWKESNGSQTQRGVSAQRLDSNGDRLWGSNGVSVVELNSNYDYLDLNIARFGDDLIATYIEQSGNMNGNIYAVRLDVNGDNVWTDGTVAVTNSNTPKSDMMIANGPGCVFIAWTEGGSIYAHCLLEDGTLGGPVIDMPLLVPSEYPTIQAAIDSASDGETVFVAVGTYVENINYNGKNIVVQGEDRETTIIDGNQSGSVVTFESGEDSTAELSGFTITNGGYIYDSPSGGIFVKGASPTISSCLIINNNAYPMDGGGIKCIASNIIIENSEISNNHGDSGGGILVCNSNININNSSINNNSVESGGNGSGIRVVPFLPPDQGGGSGLSSINILNSEFINNVSNGGYGGAIFTDNADSIIITGSYFSLNNSNQGAIYIDEGILTITNSIFHDNQGSFCNDIYIENNSNAIIYNSTLINNIESPSIFLHHNGSLTITNSILVNDLSHQIECYGDAGPNEIFVSFSNIQNGQNGINTNGNGSIGWGEGNIDADPLFCNPDSGDFTLAENSPCVGTGEDGANMGAFGVGCGIQVDWDFSLSEPVIEVMGTDNVWNPGDTISVEMDFCNNTDVAHNWYPGVTIESDSSLTSLHIGHIWFYAMVADECHAISWVAIANTSIISDTVVTFSAYPEVLTCENQPEYCIDGDTLTFEVPIVVQVVSAEPEHFIPEVFTLHQNYPNPFNPVTSIQYELPENAFVNIRIYDLKGRLVNTLVSKGQTAGYKAIKWAGVDDKGKAVSAGIYLYEIQAGNFRDTKKMVLLK